MATMHPDAAAIDRVGSATIQDHFGITRQAVHQWRRGGVPRTCRKPLILLGELHGHDMTDLSVTPAPGVEPVVAG